MRLEDVQIGGVYRYKRHPNSPETAIDGRADGCLMRVTDRRYERDVPDGMRYSHMCEVVRANGHLPIGLYWGVHYLSLHSIELPSLPGKFSEWAKSCA